ncbi:MAG: prepilin-type N-terminal cleavage/methylation domain-containing protein [Myxococcota bacterium]|jgi:prepilin-type N-terminal cleavage/methylation domain-containing protein|nr:prepilin-type N-terminal cleavage/methylation domain-containing protein [Myxococcota bacterium]
MKQVSSKRWTRRSRVGTVGGFTMIELVITVSIFCILATIGWSSTRQYLPRYRMIQVAKSIQSDLARLQGLSVQANRETRLLLTAAGSCSDSDGYGGTWELQVGDRSRGSRSWELLPADAFDDGSDDDQSEGRVDIGDDGEDKARGVCLEEWGTIAGPGTGNQDAIVYSPRGWLRNPASDFGTSGYLAVTLVNQVAANAGVEDEVEVLVARSGMTRLQTSLGEAFPTNEVGTGTGSSVE